MQRRSLQLLGLALVAVAAIAFSAEVVVTKDNALSFYRGFPRLTKQPHLVAPLTAALCTIPSQAAVERERQMTGPHYMAAVHLYANPVALPAAKQKTTFPVGSVIVKEKLAEDGKVVGVGGMIKRNAGYDASNGDWEYFYSGGSGEFSSGHLDSCVDCHRAAMKSDYVYSVWKLAE